MTLGPALAGGIRALGLDVGAATQAKLLRYVALLEKWNRTYNLTAIREPERMVSHHLLDSLAVLPHFPNITPLSVIDIGSGAGLPGIPIALARPDWRVALLDSNGKKTAFLRQAVAELGLENCEVVAMRVEDYRPALLFDVAISRAYANLETFVADAAGLIKPSGRWLAMKGGYPRAELERVARHVRVVGAPRLEIPGLDAERHLLIMEPRPA
jgi:16S rRNA (guanine527-N7)-methyltransferase